MTTAVHPDLEAKLVDYLTAHPLLAGATVTTELPHVPPATCLVLTMIAGPRTNADVWLTAGRFQVAAWAKAGGKAAARDLAARARRACHELSNVRSAGAVLTGCTITQGPAWQPDTVTTPETPRYIMVIDLHAHP